MLGRIVSASFATLISVAFISFALGQTFEVASVKPSGPPPQGPRIEGGSKVVQARLIPRGSLIPERRCNSLSEKRTACPSIRFKVPDGSRRRNTTL